MKKKYLIGLFLALTVCSGLMFSLPVPVIKADTLPAIPDIGNSDRINFLSSLLGSVFDNNTRGNLSTNLIFGNTTAYFYLTFDGNYSYSDTDVYFYGLIYTGIDTASGDKIYLESNLSVSTLNIDFLQNMSLLTILWDNDKSLINLLRNIDNATTFGDDDAVGSFLLNALLHIDQILTGDEMLVIVPTMFWKFDIQLDYELINYYIIDEDNDGPSNDPKNEYAALNSTIKALINQAVENDPSLAPLVNSSGAQSISDSYSNFFFMISEFWAKQIYWGFRIFPPAFTYNFDLVLASHRLLGAVLYNDSNSNGLMDVEFKSDNNTGYYYPEVDEAMFSLELINATSCTFGDPIIDEGNKELSWNATLNDPWVRLNPWGVTAEQGLVLNTTKIPIDDTSFGFTFKPQVSQGGQTTSLKAGLKLDHTIGAFNGTSGLMGDYSDLDLAVLYATDVFELQAQNSFNANTPEINSSMSGSGGSIDSYTITKTSSETETLNFFVGSSRVSGLDLAEENYSINGDEIYKAKGSVIPYAMYANRYLETGEVIDSQVGDVAASWSINTNFSRSIGAYVITYPDFNGSKIVHDPEFSLYGSITSDSIPGFEWIFILPGLAIVAIVVILAKKRQIKI